LWRRLPTHRRPPPSGFRNLSAVSSRWCLAGLFHPAGTCRLPPSGPFPLEEPHRLSAALLPSCRYHRPSSSLRSRRNGSSTSGPCSPRKSVAHPAAVKRPGARCPPGVSPLQGSPSSGRSTRFRALPLSSFGQGRTRRPCACPAGSFRPEARLSSREVADPPGVSGLFESLIRTGWDRSGLSFRLRLDAPSPDARQPSLTLSANPTGAG